ncbi:hypothetical protein Taro_014123, partial [Colocasia esculenta]|nr:hypothetical protein [Colocasia esculenta]
MIPFPLVNVFRVLGRVPGETAPEPCSAGDAVASEAAIMSRRCARPRHGRDARVVTVAWDPRPWEPVEGVLRATSVLELAATRRTPELRGKRWLGQWRVSHLQSSRGWSGTPRTVRSSTRHRPASPSSHCLAPYGLGTIWRGQFFRTLYQEAWQLGQAAVGGQPPVPPPVVPEQQADPKVEQPAVQQASGTGSTQAGRRRTTVTEDRTALLERFLHLRPPMFFGDYDPYKAESWTHEMERTFETMECAEEDQVRLVVYQLKKVAHELWRVQRQTHFQGQRLDQITWQQFLEVFHSEYFPDYARRERRDQFHELVQDDLAVTQYHQRFVRLLRHVPHVAGSEQACAERFITGLRPDLRWGVTAHMCATLGEAVAKATALERETWQPQQQQGGASSRSSPYQRPAGSRGSTTSSSWAREVPAAPGSAQSSGSCLLTGVDGARSRGVSRGLRSSQSSKELSRASRRQFATLVVPQPQQAPQHGRGRVMALTREQAKALNL